MLYDWLRICLMTVGVSSCTSEFNKGVVPPPVKEVKGVLYVPMTRGTPEEESAITASRMIVFKANGDFVLNTNQPEHWTPTPTFIDTVPAGYLNVYLIANERSGWNLANITTEAQLKKVQYDYITDYATKLPEADGTHPIPMFGMQKNVYVDMNGELNSYRIGVKRIFAKVTLRLSCLFSEQNNGNTPLELDSIWLMRIPSWSYLYAAETVVFGDTLMLPERFIGPFNSAIHPFYPNPASPPAGWPKSHYEEDAGKFLDTVTFYIPEYLPNDTSTYTFLSLRVNVKNQPSIAKTYRLILGEGLKYGLRFMRGDSILPADPPHRPDPHQRDIMDLSIQRNTHYTITAKVKNFGLTGKEDLDVYLQVEDWMETEVDTTDIGNYMLNISQGEFEIPVGHMSVVNIETDHPKGWSATVTGSLVLTDSGVSSLAGQDSGPLTFKATSAGTYYIHVTIGKITRHIKVEAS
jgi:hypothetical protein